MGVAGLIDAIIQQYRPEESDADAAAARDKRKLHLSQFMDGWWHLSGLLDPETGDRLNAALDVHADPTGPDDDRSAPMRRADAIGQIADTAVAGIDRPSGRGQVVIRFTADQLQDRRGVRWPGGALMTRADVDSLTCSAQVTTVVGIDTPTGWQPVSVGFTERFATRAQRAALETCDGPTCIADGCTVKTNGCLAHHLTHGNQGGASDIDNYALVCGHHHNLALQDRLRLHIRPDGSCRLHHRRQ